MNWEKFDQNLNIEEFQTQMNGGRDYAPVPHGAYEVKVQKMELKESRKGDPMVSIWFKILDGEYKNSLIFYNQVVRHPFQCKLAIDMLQSLVQGIDVHFEGYQKLATDIQDIHNHIEGEGYEYALSYTQGSKGYDVFHIDTVY